MSLHSHIPNALTSCNLLSGVVGLFFAFEGLPGAAFLLMLAAAAFDFLDGFAARLLNARSPIGAELDSLADEVSFGVLPAVLLAQMMRSCTGLGGWVFVLCALPLLIAVFSALRLAKFNTDSRQHSSFLGLPTPAAAILCGSLAACCELRPGSALSVFFAHWWAVAALSVAVCALLVCGVPFFSFKGLGKKDLTENRKRLVFACVSSVVVVLAVILAWPWPAVPLGISLIYISENLILSLIRQKTTA